MIDQGYLKQLLEEHDLTVTQLQLQQFDRYADLLVEWNEKMNLTAITEPSEICKKHFLDSVLLSTKVQLPQGATIIDVGTGAGFPSMPLKILDPTLQVTMLDSLNKRINFLSTVAEELDLEVTCVHARAEDGGKNVKLREQFDFATARAVAHLRELSEYCLPFVKVGGAFVALKGYEIETELEEAKNAITLLGGKVEEVLKYQLTDDQKRAVVVIKKISHTPTKYPRNSAKIKKQSL